MTTGTGRAIGQPRNAWGDYVYAKRHAVAVFEAELGKLRGGGRVPSLLLSSVTARTRASSGSAG